jgi:dephospho-CoA kinase
MLVFITGSINSGKTTTSKLLADKLGAEYINFDDLKYLIPGLDLKSDSSLSH